MAKKSSNVHRWAVGILLWAGVIYGSFTGSYGSAFVGIAIALAYLIYYK